MTRTDRYLSLLPAIREAAKACGYAVGVHGSTERDFDLIAAPWVEDARPAADLAEAVRSAVGGIIIPTGTPGGRWDADAGEFVAADVQNPKTKPHGRLAWAIQIGGGAYLDLSVMPTKGPTT